MTGGELEHDREAGEEGRSADELRAEISRGQRLDRDLARDLGRPAPERSAGAPGYVAALARRPTLPPATELELVRAAKSGDPVARARLVDAFMPLISASARTYGSAHVHRVELLQEGVVGLLRALERFDLQRGIPFWGYASWWVRQAMQQLVSELTRPVVLSDRALRHLARLKQAHHDELQHPGRPPTRARPRRAPGAAPRPGRRPPPPRARAALAPGAGCRRGRRDR